MAQTPRWRLGADSWTVSLCEQKIGLSKKTLRALHEAVQHERQNTASTEVIQLVGRVDAHHTFNILHLATFADNELKC